jgi:hypothetical protein
MTITKEFTNYEIGRMMYEMERADGAMYGQTIRDFIEDCTDWKLDCLDYQYKQIMEYYEDPDYSDAVGDVLYEYLETLYNECRERLTGERWIPEPIPQDVTNVATTKGQIIPKMIERLDT